MVDGGKPRGLERRRHPHGASGRSDREALTEGLELATRRDGRVHELDLVEHPLAVVVDESEVDRPGGATATEATVERAREQHVDRPHEHRLPLWLERPGVVGHPAHQRVDLDWVREAPGRVEAFERAAHAGKRLLDEHMHRQGDEQATGGATALCLVRVEEPPPEPVEKHGLRLAGAGRGRNDARLRLAQREAPLPVVRGSGAGCFREERVERPS